MILISTRPTLFFRRWVFTRLVTAGSVTAWTVWAAVAGLGAYRSGGGGLMTGHTKEAFLHCLFVYLSVLFGV